MTFDPKEVLVQEYFQLQKTVEEFDGKAITIKAWSVTLSAAGIVTAYTEGKALVLLIASASAFVFWLIEALWKSNQHAFYERLKTIEKTFRNEHSNTDPLQITESWDKSWRKHWYGAYALYVMLWPHVMLPHIVVAIAGIFLFVHCPPVPTPAPH